MSLVERTGFGNFFCVFFFFIVFLYKMGMVVLWRNAKTTETKKKRIEIRKLGSKGLEHKFVKLFLKLLDYINQVS